jgi:F-type H+-transporting ATPase subunit a
MSIRPFITRNLRAIFSTVLVLFLSGKILAHEPTEPEHDTTRAASTEHHVADTAKKKVDITEVAFEHILDAHSWHLWGDHHHPTGFHLPVILKTDAGIKIFSSSAFNWDTHGTVVAEVDGQRFVNYKENIYYASETENEHGQFLTMTKNDKGETVIENKAPLDFSITKNVLQLFLTAIILIVLFMSMASAYKKTGITSAPKGKQSVLEPLIIFVRDDIAKENIGHGKHHKFVPFLLTVFFLILINNVLGLVPVSANLTGNIAFTLVLSVVTLIITNINASGAYWKHIFAPKPAALWIILMPIELVGVFSKPFALMIRLFANIAGGHIVVISLVGLIFIFESYAIAPVSIAFTLFIDILECLVALLQAYIFTMLTALFIGSAMEDHSHGHDEAHAEAH